MQKKTLTLLGTAFHTPRRGQLEVLEAHLFHLDDQGAIQELIPPGSDAYPALKQAAAREGSLIELPPGQILLPGLIDLHIHAPQWPQMGKALDVPLEVWLQTYTFPLEARFSDSGFAQTVYTQLVETLLANGTTTAVYFGTIHLEATLLLARICKAKGQRALIGKVVMDHPEQCPPFYRDADSQTALDLSEKFIDAISELGLTSGRHPLLLPALTPRFIPSCTDAALAGLGALARHRETHVQTHCAESDWQSRFVENRLGMSDPAALDHFGLLTRKTILAHGNFLESCDLERIADRGSGIAHCPLSNIFFANAIFPLCDALKQGVHTGLGTDIAGGYSPSLFDSLRQAVSASRLRQSGVDASLPPERRGAQESAIDHREAFWLATAGGAEALDLALGRFAPGYAFDALVLDPETAASNLFFMAGESREDQFQKLLLNATRANIVQTWVQGRRVFCQAEALASSGS